MGRRGFDDYQFGIADSVWSGSVGVVYLSGNSAERFYG